MIAQALTSQSYRFSRETLIDTTPLPASIPKVEEIGASSAPLLSAAYFIGARCQPYNDDFMKCKTEANGKGEIECLKEGRKVTRCAQSVYVQSMHSPTILNTTGNMSWRGDSIQLSRNILTGARE